MTTMGHPDSPWIRDYSVPKSNCKADLDDHDQPQPTAIAHECWKLGREVCILRRRCLSTLESALFRSPHPWLTGSSTLATSNQAKSLAEVARPSFIDERRSKTIGYCFGSTTISICDMVDQTRWINTRASPMPRSRQARRSGGCAWHASSPRDASWRPRDHLRLRNSRTSSPIVLACGDNTRLARAGSSTPRSPSSWRRLGREAKPKFGFAHRLTRRIPRKVAPRRCDCRLRKKSGGGVESAQRTSTPIYTPADAGTSARPERSGKGPDGRKDAKPKKQSFTSAGDSANSRRRRTPRAGRSLGCLSESWRRAAKSSKDSYGLSTRQADSPSNPVGRLCSWSPCGWNAPTAGFPTRAKPARTCVDSACFWAPPSPFRAVPVSSLELPFEAAELANGLTVLRGRRTCLARDSLRTSSIASGRRTSDGSVRASPTSSST